MMLKMALKSRHGFLPSLEQIGIAKGPPSRAPMSQVVTVTACEVAESAGESDSRPKDFKNDGRTSTPLITPTEYPKRADV